MADPKWFDEFNDHGNWVRDLQHAEAISDVVTQLFFNHLCGGADQGTSSGGRHKASDGRAAGTSTKGGRAGIGAAERRSGSAQHGKGGL